MKIITFTNEKGGVGKTTLALHTAAGLALMGKRVLLVDSDPQGHCAQQLKVKEFGGLYRLLVQDEEWKNVLREPAFAQWGGTYPTIGRLLLLPSNIETRAIPMMVSNPGLLRERLNEMEGAVDVVVIDTSPTPSLLQVMLYAATDYVVFPTLCESLSLHGLNKAGGHISQQNKARQGFGLNGQAELMAVIPTMYNGNTAAHQHGLDLLEQHFGTELIWSPFAQRTVWREAGYQQQTLFAYAPTHDVTAEVAAMVAKVARYAA